MNRLRSLNPFVRDIFFLWLGWMAVMLLFQAYVPARFNIGRPDNALSWTAEETARGSQAGRLYLNEPFLNSHVSWDSEFYLSISVIGYNDPAIRTANVDFGDMGTGVGFWPFYLPPNLGPSHQLSLSYAFFPFYPLVMRVFSVPLSLIGLNQIATATLAGVIVSMLGALAGMISMYDIARDELGDDGGLRAAFYLIIFPSAMFMAQVYTEGLFIGLAFASLALMRRKHLGWAALLASFATLTRAVGVSLVIPLFIAWVGTQEWRDIDLEWRQIYLKGIPWKTIGRALLAIAPLLTFVLWRTSFYGLAFSKVEDVFFGRGFLSFGNSFVTWSNAFHALLGSNSQAAAYHALEFGAIALGVIACVLEFRKNADLAWFGSLVIFFSLTSGPAQGMHRYILAAPPVFMFLARLGKSKPFDKVWSIASILLMSVLTILFTFDMWAG